MFVEKHITRHQSLLQSLRSLRGTAIKRAAPWHGVICTYKFEMKLILGVLFIWIVSAIVWSDYQSKRWPCEYRTYESLIAEYPSLKVLWDQNTALINMPEYEEKITIARLELWEQQGKIDMTEVFDREMQEAEKTFSLIEVQSKKFTAQCHLLTGSEPRK